MASFSERMGLQPDEVEITVRQDAPYELRGIVVNQAYDAGLAPHSLRSLVCDVLQTREDPSNWSAYPNVDGEVRGLIDGCAWYEVYDVIEAIYERLRKLSASQEQTDAQRFADSMNKYFRRKGVGWQLVDGRIETRGAEGFEHSLAEARSELASSGRTTAANEIHQAISDLSRRPTPDVTGAIQHAMAALECVARDVVGDKKATLGKLLSANPNLIPPPLNQAVDKIWGFASERGRHLSEGRSPSFDDAELTVQVAAAVARYISRRHDLAKMLE